MSKKFAENWDKYQVDLIPVEYKVVILPDKVSEKLGKEEIIISPETVQDMDQRAQVRGTVIAVSEMAFNDWVGYKPKVGDRVYYGKYAGIITDEEDDNEVQYRIINDKDIACIIKKRA